MKNRKTDRWEAQCMESNLVFEIEWKEGCEFTHNCLLFEEFKKKKSTVLFVKYPPLPNISPPPLVMSQNSIFKTLNFRHLQKYTTTVDFLKCVINITPHVKAEKFSRGGGY